MISDDERREVAARLRTTKAECDERGYPWMVEDLMQALGFGTYEDGDEGILDRLADLIDCQTCHVTSRDGDDENDVCKSCSVCDFGWHKSRFDPPYRHCPNCGAVVVENGEDDV